MNWEIAGQCCLGVCAFTGGIVILVIGLWVLDGFTAAVVNWMSRKNRPLRVLVEYVLNRKEYQRWLKEKEKNGDAEKVASR